MNNNCSFLALALSLLIYLNPATAQVGAIAGSNLISISQGTTSAPTYKIVSASTIGDAVFSGFVDAVDDSDTLSFATSTDDDNNTVYPFFAAGAFNKDTQVPVLTTTVSGTAVSGISVSYGTDGYQSALTGFTNPPQILISSGTDDNISTASANLSSGEITSISITNGGSGYSGGGDVPEAIVIGGPHLLRIVDTSSSHYGRVFLITNNTQTTLDLDFSILANGETATASNFFSAGIAVEVVKAPTLGNIFGISSLPTNWSTATSLRNINSADWVYIWDPSRGGYSTMFFVNDGAGGLANGWYGLATVRASMNNMVIYPDEAFIVAKRTSGNVELEIEGTISTETQKLFLPETNDQMLCNNPYGMSLLLAELIPSTAIGSGNSKFRPGSSDDGTCDYVTILSGSTWKRFWYKSGENDAITSMMVAGSRAGTAGGNNGIQSSDLFIGSGSVSGMTSWQNSNSAGSVTGNDANYTFISASGTLPEAGFTVTLSGINGRMLNDSGTAEVNATTGEEVSAGSGSEILSNLNSEHLVVFKQSSPAGFVIEKQRDCNYSSGGTWSVGTLGSGYSASIDAKWWAVGGNNGTTDSNASGTVDNTGSFTVSNAGSGYTTAPQIVISGSGWRYSDSSPRGNEVIGASDGIIISRRAANGVKSFIEPLNPSN